MLHEFHEDSWHSLVNDFPNIEDDQKNDWNRP